MRSTIIASVLCIILYSGSWARPSDDIKLGIDRPVLYMPHLEGKNVGLLCNQASVDSQGLHSIERLRHLGVRIKLLFSPEHGLRDYKDAGEKVKSGLDRQTGLRVLSLYGKKHGPTVRDLRDLDLVIYDLQDVGCRFYTYISTLHYMMKACATAGIPLMILDRPNPNDIVAGPTLKEDFKSFVGMHPIPVLYGMTVAELARMINAESYLGDWVRCQLIIIPLKGWKHGQQYNLPRPPSPNLPNMQAIRLYPSLCFFEASSWSVGRGTEHPFQCIGYPEPSLGCFQFEPRPRAGAKKPKLEYKRCYGTDMREWKTDSPFFDIGILIQAYQASKSRDIKFIERANFMDLLAGSAELRKDLEKGKTKAEIEKSWERDLEHFLELRQKHLLYPEERREYIF